MIWMTWLWVNCRLNIHALVLCNYLKFIAIYGQDQPLLMENMSLGSANLSIGIAHIKGCGTSFSRGPSIIVDIFLYDNSYHVYNYGRPLAICLSTHLIQNIMAISPGPNLIWICEYVNSYRFFVCWLGWFYWRPCVFGTQQYIWSVTE